MADRQIMLISPTREGLAVAEVADIKARIAREFHEAGMAVPFVIVLPAGLTASMVNAAELAPPTGYIWKVRNKAGHVVECAYIPEEWVTPIAGNGQLIDRYQVRPTGPGPTGRVMELAASDVVRISSPVVSLRDEQSAVLSDDERRKAREWYDATFPGVEFRPYRLSDERRQELRRMYEAMVRAGDVTLIPADSHASGVWGDKSAATATVVCGPSVQETSDAFMRGVTPGAVVQFIEESEKARAAEPPPESPKRSNRGYELL